MGKKILFIEDEKNIILSVKMCLEGAGYQVNVVKDGGLAIEEAYNFLPDLILLNIVLPKMDGYLVLEALKKEEKTKSIPVVMLSAKSQEEDIKKAMELGADDYLVKPFGPSKLLHTMERFLRRNKIKGN